MGYTFLRCFSKFICCLPHGLQYAIGGFLGRLMWCILPPKRKRLAIGQILFCKITDDKKEAFDLISYVTETPETVSENVTAETESSIIIIGASLR